MGGTGSRHYINSTDTERSLEDCAPTLQHQTETSVTHAYTFLTNFKLMLVSNFKGILCIYISQITLNWWQYSRLVSGLYVRVCVRVISSVCVSVKVDKEREKFDN